MAEPSPPDRSSADADARDRRARVRYSSALETYCQPGTGSLETFWWLAKVRDVSRTGIGLVVPHRFDAGTLLTVEVQDPAEDYARTLHVHVVHAAALPEGGWLLGCTLQTELSDDEIQRLR